MAVSKDAVAVAQQQKFKDRVNYFVIKAGLAVMTESGATESHTERVAFANKVFISDYSLSQYVAAVLTNATVLTNLSEVADDNGISDSDMEFTVNSMYNAFAGVATV